MKRRSLLSLLAALSVERLGSRSLTAAAAIEGENEGAERVIVIGAGMAGLAAARELRTHASEVLVLEARQRVGGRLWTSHKWTEAPLDLGASWIHGVIGNPLTKLADEAKAERIDTSYDRNIVYDANGQELSEAREAALERVRKRFRQALRVAQEEEDSSLRAVAIELADKLQANSETQQLINFLISSEMEQEYAGSATRLSAHWYDSAKAFGGNDALLLKGYQVIVDLLADGQEIRTGEVVQRIDWSSDIVRVVTNRGEFTADKVLVTLPLGVLKAGRVEFAPELPRATQDAIAKLEAGHLNKCYLRFPQVFWPKDIDWLEHIATEHGVWTEWVSFARGLQQPILLGFNAGDRGREIESWTDQQIVDSAMHTLRKIFGSKIPAPLDYQITRWSSDPFSLGAYSFNPVGSHPRMRQQLARPLGGKLYFAGEATEPDYFGTVHGAYLSGIRAAHEILA